MIGILAVVVLFVVLMRRVARLQMRMAGTLLEMMQEDF